MQKPENIAWFCVLLRGEKTARDKTGEIMTDLYEAYAIGGEGELQGIYILLIERKWIMNNATSTGNELDTEFCNVKYIRGDNVVLLTWKKFCCFEDYRTPTMFASALLNERTNSNFIIDAQNGFEDEKADIEWGFSVLLPSMAKSDCKSCVFIVKEVSNIEEEIDLWTKEFMKYFEVRKVTTYADAVTFINGL